MSGGERGFAPSGDDYGEEILQSSLAAAMSSGEEARIAELRALLEDPTRVQRLRFQRQYARRIRHLDGRRRDTSDDV